MNIESIENFLDKDNFEDIEKIFFSYPNYFPWYLGPGKSFEGDGHLQFVHLFFNENKINSPYFKQLDSIIELLKPNLEHGGSTCTDTNVRIVINFNYE